MTADHLDSLSKQAITTDHPLPCEHPPPTHPLPTISICEWIPYSLWGWETKLCSDVITCNMYTRTPNRCFTKQTSLNLWSNSLTEDQAGLQGEFQGGLHSSHTAGDYTAFIYTTLTLISSKKPLQLQWGTGI